MIIILVALIAIYYPKITGNSLQDYYAPQQATLTRVVDGDTIHALVNGKDETVRLLGINAPEKNMPFASAGADFLKIFVGKEITLKRDKEDTDRYSRKLRYVFYGDRFLNNEIISEGFASSYMTGGIIYEKELLDTEKIARENEKGIWQKSEEKCSTNNCIKLVKLNQFEEYFIIKNECNFDCSLTGWFVKDAGRNTFYLTPLKAGEEEKYDSASGKEIWNNDHDNFFMFDEKGLIVIYYEY